MSAAPNPRDTDRPVLTLPAAEAEAVRVAYAGAGSILEYGSGGSTVMAAEMPGKTVRAVESDRRWAQKMRRWFDDHGAADGTQLAIDWVDIGPTKAWGNPRDDSAWRLWPRYALQVWRNPDLVAPDVVFIDGRFRIGCALATAFSTQKPVTVLFDDYGDRARYAKVEDFIGRPQMVGRLAVFEVEPTPIPPEKLLNIVQFMLRP